MKKFLAIGLLTVLTGCAVFTTQPDFIEQIPVTLAPGKSMQGVIKTAALRRHWVAKDIQPGVIRCTLNVRGHMVTVDVVYSNNDFSIRYVDSANMNYKPESGELNRKYNQWVRNLEKDICNEALR